MKIDLRELKRRGFDRSERDSSRRLVLRCSQCEATAINGHPCHETGCPNQRKAEAS